MAERDGERTSKINFDTETNHQTSMKSYGEVGHKKKPTSFQITSVTVQGSRIDGGDDSADDLDESHTDDLSSDILDCSKTPDLDNEQLTEDNGNTPDDLQMPFIPPKSFRSDPTVRPITDGYDVPQPLDVTTTFHDGSAINVNAGTAEVTHSDPVVGSHIPIINTIPDHWQHRFKVVKIVSSEPFRRGRWLCMDFVDPPAMQQETKPDIIEQGAASGVSSGGSSANSVCGDGTANKTLAHVYEIPVTQSCTGDVSVSVGRQPVQPLYGIVLHTVNRTPQIAMVPSVGVQPTSDGVPQVMQAATIQQGVHVTSCLPQQGGQTQLASTSAPPSVQHNPLSSQPQLVTQTQQSVMPMSQPLPTASQPLVTNIQSISMTGTPIDQEISRQSTSKPDPNTQGPSQAMMSSNSDKVERIFSDTTTLPLLDVLPDALGTRNNADNEESAAGSTVAIDNKIEQAMDLVKSHLMFAVREEVDVLKEKITELLERISQLEYENGFLRANASQETLNQLSQIPTNQTPAVSQPTVITAPTQQQQQSST